MPHEPTLEEYDLDTSVYSNYREKIKELEKEKNSLYLSGLSIFVLIVFFVIFAFLGYFLLGNTGWGAVWLWIFFIFGAGFLDSRDYLANLFSSGKFNRIKRQIEETKLDVIKKVKAFERAFASFYGVQLEEFYKQNLYKKRSGTQHFEDALAEFSTLIDFLSKINSVFITTHVPLGIYEGYVMKRTPDHSFQSSKRHDSPNKVSSLVKRLSESQTKVIIPPERQRIAQKVNWEEINKARKLTGQKGEEIVMAIEQDFFESIGRKDLASKVRHVASEDGDGLGYDVLSFFQDGKEKYIEVKSSKASLVAPTYLSQNELGFLKEHTQDAFIYRIHISGEDFYFKAQSSTEFLEENELIPIRYMTRAR